MHDTQLPTGTHAMRSFVQAFLACLLLAPIPMAWAGFQVWTGGTPRAKGIEAIAVDPRTPTRMWAAGFGAGVFRSLDGGVTWTAYRAGLTNTFVRSLAVQPANPDSIYCGTNDGLYLSVDGGRTWMQKLSTINSVRAIVIHPIRSGIVYAATLGSGVYKSTNGGGNWNAINLGLVNTSVRDIAFDPAKPETLLAATGTGGGIHRSLNGGLSWTRSADSNASLSAVEQVVFDKIDPNRIYAATLQRGVIKSSDRGFTWLEINRGLTNFRTRSIAVVDTFRYVGTDGSGVFVSSLSDTLWHPASTGLSGLTVDALLSLPSNPLKCWAGTDGGGISVTSNQGATWSSLDGGLLATYGFSLAVRRASGAVYAGLGFGDQFWRSTDGGGTWSRASYLFSRNSEHGIAVDPLLSQTVYLAAHGSGVYRSNDDGITWSNPDSLNRTLANVFVRDLVAWPGQSGHLYVGTGNGVWESLDGAETWMQSSGGLPSPFSVRALALAPGTPSTLYAGSDLAGVWRSSDGGASWLQASNGIPVPFIHSLAVNPSAPLTAFAGTDSGLYRTTDGGTTWTPLRSGLPYGANASVRAIVQDPGHARGWFAGLYGAGVFQSRDDGITWTPVFNQSGLGNLRVRSLAVDDLRTRIFAGTDDGVWQLSQYSTADVPADPRTADLRFAVSPNPVAAGKVTFSVALAQPGPLELNVYDLHGACVRTVARFQHTAAGPHAFAWDLRDRRGVTVPPGLYFARVRTAEGLHTVRLSLLPW